MHAADELCEFLNEHPTGFHFVAGVARLLDAGGFLRLDERDLARVERGGKYYVVRNGTAVVAFAVGADWVPGPDGFAVVGTHCDANRVLLKPASRTAAAAGALRAGAAPYAGGLGRSWWDRGLGVGGRVVVKNQKSTAARLVRLPGAVATIPSLAPHFGPIASEANPEVNMVPVLGLEDGDGAGAGAADAPGGAGAGPGAPNAPLLARHPPALVHAVAAELGLPAAALLEWDLELFSAEPAARGGLRRELVHAAGLDDRLCSYAAVRGLLAAAPDPHAVQAVALFDNEEIGSRTRTGAAGNLLAVVVDLVHDSLGATPDERRQAAARSLHASADVTHAEHPNYAGAAARGLAPRLNTGVAVKQLGHFAGGPAEAALLRRVAARAGQPLQRFAPRNDTATGGTIGNIVAAGAGWRTVDVGIPIWSMHSIRETTGAEDVRLGARWFAAFLELASGLEIDE